MNWEALLGASSQFQAIKEKHEQLKQAEANLIAKQQLIKQLLAQGSLKIPPIPICHCGATEQLTYDESSHALYCDKHYAVRQEENELLSKLT